MNKSYNDIYLYGMYIQNSPYVCEDNSIHKIKCVYVTSINNLFVYLDNYILFENTYSNMIRHRYNCVFDVFSCKDDEFNFTKYGISSFYGIVYNGLTFYKHYSHFNEYSMPFVFDSVLDYWLSKDCSILFDNFCGINISTSIFFDELSGQILSFSYPLYKYLCNYSNLSDSLFGCEKPIYLFDSREQFDEVLPLMRNTFHAFRIDNYIKTNGEDHHKIDSIHYIEGVNRYFYYLKKSCSSIKNCVFNFCSELKYLFGYVQLDFEIDNEVNNKEDSEISSIEYSDKEVNEKEGNGLSNKEAIELINLEDYNKMPYEKFYKKLIDCNNKIVDDDDISNVDIFKLVCKIYDFNKDAINKTILSRCHEFKDEFEDCLYNVEDNLDELNEKIDELLYNIFKENIKKEYEENKAFPSFNVEEMVECSDSAVFDEDDEICLRREDCKEDLYNYYLSDVKIECSRFCKYFNIDMRTGASMKSNVLNELYIFDRYKVNRYGVVYEDDYYIDDLNFSLKYDHDEIFRVSKKFFKKKFVLYNSVHNFVNSMIDSKFVKVHGKYTSNLYYNKTFNNPNIKYAMCDEFINICPKFRMSELNICNILYIHECDFIKPYNYNNTIDNYNYLLYNFKYYCKSEIIRSGYGLSNLFIYNNEIECYTSLSSTKYISLFHSLYLAYISVKNILDIYIYISLFYFIENIYIINIFMFKCLIIFYPIIFIILLWLLLLHVIYSLEFLINDYIECLIFRKLCIFQLNIIIIMYLFINISLLFLGDFFGIYIYTSSEFFDYHVHNTFTPIDLNIVSIDEEVINLILYNNYIYDIISYKESVKVLGNILIR